MLSQILGTSWEFLPTAPEVLFSSTTGSSAFSAAPSALRSLLAAPYHNLR
jgi:hypothetical protein